MPIANTTVELRRRLQAILAGRYVIERELGQGGMATVFLAQDVRLGRAVAIKLLDPALTSTIGVERFLREIAITARLHHPHILTLIESGQDGGLVYYVMPHIEGESLRDRLKREPAISVTGAVWIAREVADALTYAHARAVIHRDIKPENILLSDGHAWVADFGIARAIETCAGDSDKALTLTGLPIGTPAYMSPEQAEGRPDVDGRSDVYSLGCVLFEMLTGRPPFLGRSARAVMQQHVATPPPSLAELRPDLPPELHATVERAIAKKPNDRHPSARVFGDELQLIAANAVASHATPPDPHARAAASGIRRAVAGAPEPRGNRSGVLLLGSAAVAAIALLATTLLPWGGRRPEPRDPPTAAATRTGAAPAPGAGAYRSSMAVMPLASYGGDSESAFLSEGITEELIAQLAGIRGLKVISRTSVVALARKGLTVPQIAETLGVRHVLEGSVQRAGDRIRITLQLIDAETDAHLWAESYDRGLKDVIALRQEIAGKVAGALAIAVPGIAAGPAPPRPESSAAYEAYLRGNYWVGRTSPEGLEQAITAFEQAIRLDSTYAPAYAALSEVLQAWVTLGYRGSRDPYPTFTRASALADHALQLDSGLAAGYIARAMLRIMAWAPDDAVQGDLQRALALMPNSAQARLAYGLGLARGGRYPEAVAQMQTAVQLDPLSASMRGALAFTALGARRYDLAIEEGRRALNLEPAFAGGHAIEAVALLEQRRPESCLALDLSGFPEIRALCLQASGRGREAASLVDSASVAYRAGGYARVFQVGLVGAYYAELDDARRAAEWVERAHAVAPTGLEFRAVDSGLFDRVLDDPEFTTALARIHRQVYQRVFR
jgi:serine/threonine-protein kinase